jgi:hypothetical protein
MRKNTCLTKKQFDVIEDLLTSGMRESEILEKHKVSSALYNKWINDENFICQLENRVTVAYKRNAARIAENVSKAVDVLTKKIDKADVDVVKKVCLDLASLQKQVLANQPPVHQKTILPENQTDTTLSDEAAGKILAALAEEK